MCGIVGFWDLKNRRMAKEQVLVAMTNTLTHRGPDDMGFFYENERDIGFGHRRLSILDLSPKGHQPMSVSGAKKNTWITYNGEIYNFKEVRRELEQIGRVFETESDTEVLLVGFEEWGMEMVARLRGMFALAIWDAKKDKIVLVRDRAGVKPLYYYFKDGLFLFASELKAFHLHPGFSKQINREALALFLQLGYIPAPYAIFEHTKKLKPGNFLEVSKNGDVREIKYWDILDWYEDGPFHKSEQETQGELEAILTESFLYRMVADVDVGLFLSGGIDSSLTAAIIQKHSSSRLKTFTIGFHETKYNEAPWARKIAQRIGTEHHEFLCSPKDALPILEKLPELYDEPFGDSSAIPTYLVSQFAKEKVKVALSADGGDELFGGYEYYWKIPSRLNILSLIPPFLRSLGARSLPYIDASGFARDKVAVLKSMLQTLSAVDVLLETKSFWKAEERKNLLNGYDAGFRMPFQDAARLEKLDTMSQMQALDFITYLPGDILAKVDRASMAVGLESRDPFLDQRVMEYAARLPLSLKYRNGQSKYILRNILAKYIPRELFERPKQGFSIPLEHWLAGSFRPLLEKYLDQRKIEQQGIFNASYVQGCLRAFQGGKQGVAHKLWLLLVFQMWYEKWMEKS